MLEVGVGGRDGRRDVVAEGRRPVAVVGRRTVVGGGAGVAEAVGLAEQLVHHLVHGAPRRDFVSHRLDGIHDRFQLVSSVLVQQAARPPGPLLRPVFA